MSAATAPGLVAGARCLWQGLVLLTRPGLRRWAVMPVLISALLFGLLAVGLGNELLALLAPDADESLVWLRWLIWLGLGIAGLIACGFLLTLLAGIIAAPFLSQLTAAVAHELDPTTLEAPQAGGWRSLGQGLAGEWRKLKYMLLLLVLPVLVMLVPGLNLLAPLCWFVVGAWLLAVEFVDYPCAHRGQHFPGVLQVVRLHRRLAFGFGGGVTLLSALPVLNCLLLPAAVAGACVLYQRYCAGGRS